MMIRCPCCKKAYEPVLGRRMTDQLIQAEFPDAQSWEREQLVSGICSDKCWDLFLGPPEEVRQAKTKLVESLTTPSKEALDGKP